MRRLHSVLAAAVLFAGSSVQAVGVDVPAQLDQLHRENATMEAYSDLPALPVSVTSRLGDNTFGNLPVALQRALLWDSGALLTDDGSSFVQVQVICGKTMEDIFLGENDIKYAGNCSIVACIDKFLNFAQSSCKASDISSQTRCAVYDNASVATRSPIWAQEGNIETDSTFRVFKYEDSDSTKVYTIVEKPSIAPTDDICPSEVSFVVPCQSISSNDSTSSDFCPPEAGAFVTDSLIREVGSSSPSSFTFKWWYILILLVVVVVALAIVVFWWRRKKRRALSGTLYQAQGLLVLSPIRNGGRSGDNFHDAGLNTGNIVTRTDDRTKSDASSATHSERILASDIVHLLQEDSVLVHCQIPMDELQFTRILASGGFGEIWMGKRLQVPVAIKKLLSSKQQLHAVQGFVEEIKLTASFDHPNIIRFIGVAWTKLENICMVIEFLETGDLQTFAERNKQSLTWATHKYPIAAGIASAISYLHARRPAPLIHRDIKAKNILLTLELQPKLIDFGVSRDRVQETMTAGIGTPYWAAPEVLEGNRYTEQSDIYSFGILLSELDTGEIPFASGHASDGDQLCAFQVLTLVITGKLKPGLSPHCPPAVASLMEECLLVDPTKRPTAVQLVDRLQSLWGDS